MQLVEPSGAIEKIRGFAARRPDQKAFFVSGSVVAKIRRDLAINDRPCINSPAMVKEYLKSGIPLSLCGFGKQLKIHQP